MSLSLYALPRPHVTTVVAKNIVDCLSQSLLHASCECSFVGGGCPPTQDTHLEKKNKAWKKGKIVFLNPITIPKSRFFILR